MDPLQEFFEEAVADERQRRRRLTGPIKVSGGGAGPAPTEPCHFEDYPEGESCPVCNDSGRVPDTGYFTLVT